jgi:hypothetical protein
MHRIWTAEDNLPNKVERAGFSYFGSFVHCGPSLSVSDKFRDAATT